MRSKSAVGAVDASAKSPTAASRAQPTPGSHGRIGKNEPRRMASPVEGDAVVGRAGDDEDPVEGDLDGRAGGHRAPRVDDQGGVVGPGGWGGGAVDGDRPGVEAGAAGGRAGTVGPQAEDDLVGGEVGGEGHPEVALDPALGRPDVGVEHVPGAVGPGLGPGRDGRARRLGGGGQRPGGVVAAGAVGRGGRRGPVAVAGRRPIVAAGAGGEDQRTPTTRREGRRVTVP